MELLVIIIILSLIFDYINGFHDAANSIATIVSTKVLTPFQAVIWAAFFNFVAFFIAKYIIGGFGIANTVSKTCSRAVYHITDYPVRGNRRYRMEPVHLVERYSFLFFPHPYRRIRRSGYHGTRL